jgi:hypothetical protein
MLVFLTVPIAGASHAEPQTGTFDVSCDARVVAVFVGVSFNCGGGVCLPVDGAAAATGTWDGTLAWTPSENGYEALDVVLWTFDADFETVGFNFASGASPIELSVDVGGTETRACIFADGGGGPFPEVSVQALREQTVSYTLAHAA